SLAVVLMTYEISRKIGNVSWLQLLFSGAIIAGIYLFHRTLPQVILVQLVLMMVLLLIVAVPFSRAAASDGRRGEGSGLKRIRKIGEDEVIAEFLRGEFQQHHEFLGYREPFAKVVAQPDLADPKENDYRRALLDRRRGRLWRELPKDTEWW